MPAIPPETRHALVLRHLPMVRRIARAVAARVPDDVDVDDLESVGLIGLIEAIDRHADHDAPAFVAYARLRVRGAIVDELRHAYGRRGARPVEPVAPVSAEELAARLPDLGELPSDAIERARVAARLHDHVRRLPDRERALVERHYLGGENLRVVGASLGMSEAHASRLLFRACTRLRLCAPELHRTA